VVQITGIDAKGAARDGGTLEYIFETNQEDLPQTVAKEKVAEVSANFMTTFYHIQIRALETGGISHNARDESIKGPAREMYFVVVLPNGKFVEPRVARRL
jgi:hypothetical protein